MTEEQPSAFWVETHLPGQIHCQHINKPLISEVVEDIVCHFSNWKSGKIERIVLSPKYA